MEENNFSSSTSEQTQILAERDYLTGLANRRGLSEYYSSLEKGCIVHALFLDIDNFKRVNDIYGHSMGDKLLVCISNLIQSHANGFVSRIGGDEYVVLMDGAVTKDEVENITKSMLSDMQNIDFRKDILSLVSLSIGIVFWQSVSQTLDDILAKCDAAMYKAKFGGKNCYKIYNASDKTLEINRTIELEMEAALKNGDFHVYLQPKINMVSSRISGAEALSRWLHPTDGIRSPKLYIPLFEKNGFITKLDMFIFEEVCRLKSEWKDEIFGHIPISVNMSRLHLYNKNLPKDLENIASKYKIPTNELELEFSEDTFIKDKEELVKMISNLQNKGFFVSIDDFGSGLSALNLLKDLEVDTIKLDREFIHESSQTARGKKVVRSVIGMCRDLKINVVTEGVETNEQSKFLCKCGCHIAQGFYYAKPLPVGEFILYAKNSMKNTLNNYLFRLNGNLKSEDGTMEGKFIGTAPEYGQGIFSDSKSLYFPGGAINENVLQLPIETLINDSYTISMWIKPKELHNWSAAMYIRFEQGFSGMIPLAWDGHSDFRVHDANEDNGWYDVGGVQLYKDIWWHFAITYNAQTEMARLYINGRLASMLEAVPTNRSCNLIVVGGDDYQCSFNGNICELAIYNEVMDNNFISDLHNKYISNEKFTALYNKNG